MSTAQKITLGIIATLLVILGIFFFIQRNNTPSANTNGGTLLFPQSGSQSIGGTGGTSGINNSSTTPITVTEPTTLPVARKLTTARVAGYAIIASSTGTIARYVEQQSGHILDVSSIDGSSDQISNTTLPGIYQALWTPDAQFVVYRSIDPKTNLVTNNAYKIPIVAGTSTAIAITPTAFPQYTRDIVFSPDGKSAFYLTPSGGGVSGNLLTLSSQKTSSIFSSPLSELVPEWNNQNAITITTKPSDSISGFAVSLNAKTGAQTSLFSNIAALTTSMSPDGKTVIAASVFGHGLSTALLNVAAGTTTSFPLNTFPEKCTWAPDGAIYCAFPQVWPNTNLPDEWYKGSFHTSDTIWRFSKNGDPEVVFDPSKEKVGEQIDAIDLAVDAGQNYLYFINKRNGTLWSAKIY